MSLVKHYSKGTMQDECVQPLKCFSLHSWSQLRAESNKSLNRELERYRFGLVLLGLLLAKLCTQL